MSTKIETVLQRIERDIPTLDAYTTGEPEMRVLIACARALKALYEDQVEYITINHLGAVNHNKCMADACAALAQLEALE